MQDVRLFIGNLDYRTLGKQVRAMVTPYGEVVDVFIPLDRSGNADRLCQGYAFVTLASDEIAQRVITGLNEQPDPFYGRVLRVSIAKPRSADNQPKSDPHEQEKTTTLESEPATT